MNLGTVAAIRSGLVLSRKLSPEISSYRYPLLNLRAIHPDGYVRPDSLEVFYATEPLRQEYLTQQDDIIIRLLVLPIDIDDEKYQYTVDKFMELAASTLPERPIYSFYSEEMDQFVQKTQEEIIKSKYERWKKDKPHS